MPLAPGTTRIRDSITAKNFVPCAECTAPVPLGVGACGACKEAVYCDVECQKLNWTREHKKLCKVFKAGGAFTDKELYDLASTTELVNKLQAASLEPYRKCFLDGTASSHYFSVGITKDTFSGKPVLFSAGMLKRPESESFLDEALTNAQSNPPTKRMMEDLDQLVLLIYLHSGKSHRLLTFIVTADYPVEKPKDDLWRGTLQLAMGAL